MSSCLTYPEKNKKISISEELPNRSVHFICYNISTHKPITTLSDSVMMNHLTKSRLFNKMSAWLKKGDYSLLDVTMRS